MLPNALRRPARLLPVLLSLLLGAGLAACDETDAAAGGGDGPSLLVYCGITMVHPIKAIGRLFEAETGVPVVLSQGGSADLYDSLKTSGVGDLYFPGSLSYRDESLGDGLLGEARRVGFNTAALIVLTGNPKGVPATPAALADPRFKVVIANPQSGSIGRESRRILGVAGLWEAALENTVFLATDSRNLNQALLDGSADVVLNWRATAFFPENRDRVQVLDIDPLLSAPKGLALSLLTFSEHPDLARRFMALAASPEGQAIFRRYGFLDAGGRGME
jgi:molybdate transport system substrate-binding protein